MKKNIIAFFLILLFLSCKKESKPNDEVKAQISITDVMGERLDSGRTVFDFQVRVENPSLKEMKIAFETVDGSAKAGKDYVQKSGIITIPAGSYNADIKIEIFGDSTRSDDKQFYVQLRDPVNAVLLPQSKGTGTIISNGTYLPVDDVGYSTPLNYPGLSLAWNDEFDERRLNRENWNTEIGGHGWGNEELQYYTNSSKNVFVTSGGYLVIEARNEQVGENKYTSARITTEGKIEIKYGRIDIRAKLPKGKGIWPALWMLGANFKSVSWPESGEIDIMELLGHEMNRVYGTLHYGKNGSPVSKGYSYVLPSGNFHDQFHVFSLVWSDARVQWLVDDVEYASIFLDELSADNPFTKPFFFIFNVAVGGRWPGSPHAHTLLPQRMIVDYIRVFQK